MAYHTFDCALPTRGGICDCGTDDAPIAPVDFDEWESAIITADEEAADQQRETAARDRWLEATGWTAVGFIDADQGLLARKAKP